MSFYWVHYARCVRKVRADLEIVHFVSYNLHVRSNSFCENVVFSKHRKTNKFHLNLHYWSTSNQKAFKLSAESDPLTDCKAKWILIRQFLSCRNKPSDINLKPPNNFCEVKKFLAIFMFRQIIPAKTWYFQSIEKQTNFILTSIIGPH